MATSMPAAAHFNGVSHIKDQYIVLLMQYDRFILHNKQLDAMDAIIEKIAGNMTDAPKESCRKRLSVPDGFEMRGSTKDHHSLLVVKE